MNPQLPTLATETRAAESQQQVRRRAFE